MTVESIDVSTQYKLVHELTAEQKRELLAFYHNSWWGKERELEDVEKTIQGAYLIFGLIEEKTSKLVGFARIITDHFKYVYIYDVMVDPAYRKQGFATRIMNEIMMHPELRHLRCFELTCIREMRSFYEKFNFSEDFGNDVVAMRCVNPNGKT